MTETTVSFFKHAECDCYGLLVNEVRLGFSTLVEVVSVTLNVPITDVEF